MQALVKLDALDNNRMFSTLQVGWQGLLVLVLFFSCVASFMHGNSTVLCDLHRLAGACNM